MLCKGLKVLFFRPLQIRLNFIDHAQNYLLLFALKSPKWSPSDDTMFPQSFESGPKALFWL